MKLSALDRLHEGRLTRMLLTSSMKRPVAPDITELLKPSRSHLKVRVKNRRVVYKTEVLFLFRVTLDGSHRSDMMIPLTVDTSTEQVMRSLKGHAAAFFPSVPNRDVAGFRYTLRRAYRAAERAIGDSIRRTAASTLDRAREKKTVQTRRIRSYYDALIQEELEPIKTIIRRMAVFTVRADGTPSADREKKYRRRIEAIRSHLRDLEVAYEQNLASLVAERERRLDEVRHMYEVRASVSISQIALHVVPRVQWDVVLSGAGEREVTVEYDVLRKRLVSFTCEACDLSFSGDVTVCHCEMLLCSDCFVKCAGCDDLVCAACAASMCDHCGEPVCPDCGDTCPLVDGVDGETVPVCFQCHRHLCGYCIAFAPAVKY